MASRCCPCLHDEEPCDECRTEEGVNTVEEKSSDKVAKTCSTCSKQFLTEGKDTKCESCRESGRTLLNEHRS